MSYLGFDTTKYEPSKGFRAIPREDLKNPFKMTIIESGMREVKGKPEHEFLELVMEIVEGPHKGRRVWDRLNIKNTNKDTERWAREDLSAVRCATGVIGLKDSAQLHGKVFSAMLKFVAATDSYGEKNEVIEYIAKGKKKKAEPEEEVDEHLKKAEVEEEEEEYEEGEEEELEEDEYEEDGEDEDADWDSD